HAARTADRLRPPGAVGGGGAHGVPGGPGARHALGMAACAARDGPGGGVTAPPGYTAVAARGVRALVRSDLAETLTPWLLAIPFAPWPGSERLAGGRGAAWRFTLPDGLRAVLRCYRRGGLVARLVRE